MSVADTPDTDPGMVAPDRVPGEIPDDALNLPRNATVETAGPVARTPAAREKAATEDETPPVPPGEIAELLTALDKAVRARRLYRPNNPVYRGFVSAAQSLFDHLWDWVPSLSVVVEDGLFRWHGSEFRVGEGRENLPYVFHKDGIRYLTFLPGFEEEVERFIDVVNAARQTGPQGEDDLVTLLWGQEFASFQYSYVDSLAEGLSVPGAPSVRVSRVGRAEVERDLQGADGEPTPPAVQQGQSTVAGSLSRQDFEETLYFLDPAELEILRREVELEWERDTKDAVLDALFDRIEDPIAERQIEVVHILRQLLPVYLNRGDLQAVSRIVTEINRLAEQSGWGEAVRMEVDHLFTDLGDPAVLDQLLRSLEEGLIDPAGEELGVFLSHLGGAALPTLIRTLETTEVQQLRERLRGAVEVLARDNANELAKLIEADDPPLSAGAIRMAGQLRLSEAGPPLARLMSRADAAQRRQLLDALLSVGSIVALEAVQQSLTDADREIRIAAARGLAAVRYQPARARLAEIIQGRGVRDADLTEKVAFFEAFGAVAGSENVGMLDQLLNGRRLFSKADPEIRSCAAMALGGMSVPAARAALDRARNDSQPMVRNAVAKAIREGRSGR